MIHRILKKHVVRRLPFWWRIPASIALTLSFLLIRRFMKRGKN